MMNTKTLWFIIFGIGIAAALIAAMILGYPEQAIGQTQTPSSTTVRWEEILAPWYPILVPVFSSLMLAIAFWATTLLQRWTGIIIEKTHMETLQKAIENAAGKTVMILGAQMKNAELNLQHPAVRQAIMYVNQSAADSVKKFDLDSSQLAEKIIAKIGVLTAPNPEVAPSDITPPPPDPGKGA